jgi:hypothetical protein
MMNNSYVLSPTERTPPSLINRLIAKSKRLTQAELWLSTNIRKTMRNPILKHPLAYYAILIIWPQAVLPFLMIDGFAKRS